MESRAGLLQNQPRLALEVGVTATPRHDSGEILAHTVCD